MSSGLLTLNDFFLLYLIATGLLVSADLSFGSAKSDCQPLPLLSLGASVPTLLTPIFLPLFFLCVPPFNLPKGPLCWRRDVPSAVFCVLLFCFSFNAWFSTSGIFRVFGSNVFLAVLVSLWLI